MPAINSEYYSFNYNLVLVKSPPQTNPSTHRTNLVKNIISDSTISPPEALTLPSISIPPPVDAIELTADLTNDDDGILGLSTQTLSSIFTS